MPNKKMLTSYTRGGQTFLLTDNFQKISSTAGCKKKIFFACFSLVKPKIPQFIVILFKIMPTNLVVNHKNFVTVAAKNLWRAAQWPRLGYTQSLPYTAFKGKFVYLSAVVFYYNIPLIQKTKRLKTIHNLTKVSYDFKIGNKL
jgi:hypothetical protein